jgi:ubiquinone/menaquinone biosynthesis C-methylase UbiE
MAIIDEASLGQLLAEGVKLETIEPQIYSVCPDAGEARLYDKMAKFYDLVVCNRFYNRVVWGYSVKKYEAVVQKALESADSGWVLDAGCGSLAFSARSYRGYSQRPIILLDKSLTLLRIAKARMVQLNQQVPANMVFLQGDALQLPFKPHSIRTVISMNLLHVIPELNDVVKGIKNILENNGTAVFTTLVKSKRSLANRYLNYMGSLGEAVPRDISQLLAVFQELNMPVKHEIAGNLAFINYG